MHEPNRSMEWKECQNHFQGPICFSAMTETAELGWLYLKVPSSSCSWLIKSPKSGVTVLRNPRPRNIMLKRETLESVLYFHQSIFKY
ncbi:hypothetical protein Lal_00021982 [Lupinus albus]|nr:hypothetical protein Lal_00021982 [Lupinus albus]